MKEIQENTRGYLLNCYLDLEYAEQTAEEKENNFYRFKDIEEGEVLFEQITDPKSGIIYLIVRLDGYKISKIK